jgi:hypothetical protein
MALQRYVLTATVTVPAGTAATPPLGFMPSYWTVCAAAAGLRPILALTSYSDN